MYLGQTNPTLPVFLQATLDTSNKVLLDSNALYRLRFVVSGTDFTSFLTGTNCPDELCSGLTVGIEVPDSAGTGHVIRWYTGEIEQSFYDLRAEFCFPTERFPNQNFLRHTWWRLGQSAPNPLILLENSSYYELENFASTTLQVTQIDAPNNYMNLGQSNCWFCSNAMMMYTAPTYPDAQHLSYVEVLPSPNVATPQTVTVEVGFNMTLNYQPFVQLRGGQVVGDTLRHSVNLLSNGGTLCGYNFVDLIFEHDDMYTYRAGRLDLNGPMACMSFGNGGTLRVDDGATLTYGKPGNGMIAFRTGGHIELGQNAELVIGGSLVIGEYGHEQTPQTFEIHLKRGNKLTFAQGARLRNFMSKFPESTYLDIYLEGGILDDSGLSASDRALIHRHYPSVMDELAENFKVLGNPFADELTFSLTSRSGIPIRVELLALDGRKLLEMDAITQDGINAHIFKTGALPAGVYLLSLTTLYGKCARRVMH